MFRGLKNIASDIRSEVSSTEQTVYAHTHSHSQSITGPGSARTKRFLPNSLSKHSSNGTDGGANGNGRGKSKYRLDEEFDGRTEDDTVVHRAFLRYFRDEIKSVELLISTGHSKIWLNCYKFGNSRSKGDDDFAKKLVMYLEEIWVGDSPEEHILFLTVSSFLA